jgi:hypothetical protein
MRFSIRWLLAVMAYVALLAAAVGSRSAVLTDAICGISLLAICYAIVVAVVDRGLRQAMAVGFAAVAAVHLVCMYTIPYGVPASRLYQAAGYMVEGGLVYVPTSAGSGGRSVSMPGFRPVTGLVPGTRESNAVVTLLAGFVGCWLGHVAYKNRRGEGEGIGG